MYRKGRVVRGQSAGRRRNRVGPESVCPWFCASRVANPPPRATLRTRVSARAAASLRPVSLAHRLPCDPGDPVPAGRALPICAQDPDVVDEAASVAGPALSALWRASGLGGTGDRAEVPLCRVAGGRANGRLRESLLV